MQINLEYDVGLPALFQRPLRGARFRPPQKRWLIVVAHDQDFWLSEFRVGENHEVELQKEWTAGDYSEFWDVIRSMDLERRKYWLCGWRVRHALHCAGLLSALDVGKIKLPITKSESGKTAHKGALAIGPNCLDLDLIVGRHKIKCLDYQNFGLLPGDYVSSLAFVTPVIAEQVFRNFVKALGVCSLSASRPTGAQVGWAALRSSSCMETLMVNADPEARALERRAYYGGRNEAFRLGPIPGKTYSFDVKGCYANICEMKDLPVYLEREYRGGVSLDAIDLAGDKHWIADCVLQTEAPDYPLRFCDAPVYPIGEFATSLCWPELRHALERCRVKKITSAACYVAAPALRVYALWFQAAKASLDALGLGACRGMLKSVFNASLGFSARRAYDWKPWNTEIGRKWWMGVIDAPDHSCPAVSAHILDGASEWLKIGGEPREAVPYLHATICSYARVRLLELMELVGRANVLYVDTDGLLVTEFGKDILSLAPGVVGSASGQLVERFPAGKCHINGQKNYRLGENTVCSGLVKTRHSSWTEQPVLTTTTGRSDTHGNVFPFEFRCEDRGDQCFNYRNEIA